MSKGKQKNVVLTHNFSHTHVRSKTKSRMQRPSDNEAWQKSKQLFINRSNCCKNASVRQTRIWKKPRDSGMKWVLQELKPPRVSWLKSPAPTHSPIMLHQTTKCKLRRRPTATHPRERPMPNWLRRIAAERTAERCPLLNHNFKEMNRQRSELVELTKRLSYQLVQKVHKVRTHRTSHRLAKAVITQVLSNSRCPLQSSKKRNARLLNWERFKLRQKLDINRKQKKKASRKDGISMVISKTLNQVLNHCNLTKIVKMRVIAMTYPDNSRIVRALEGARLRPRECKPASQQSITPSKSRAPGTSSHRTSEHQVGLVAPLTRKLPWNWIRIWQLLWWAWCRRRRVVRIRKHLGTEISTWPTYRAFWLEWAKKIQTERQLTNW